MLVSFTLSMPNVASWNGKWSGEGNCYVRVRSFRKNPPAEQYHRYNFGDGWAAGVTVKYIDKSAANKLRKASAGFCGYDWMIDQIIGHGRILTLDEQVAA